MDIMFVQMEAHNNGPVLFNATLLVYLNCGCLWPRLVRMETDSAGRFFFLHFAHLTKTNLSC